MLLNQINSNNINRIICHCGFLNENRNCKQTHRSLLLQTNILCNQQTNCTKRTQVKEDKLCTSLNNLNPQTISQTRKQVRMLFRAEIRKPFLFGLNSCCFTEITMFFSCKLIGLCTCWICLDLTLYYIMMLRF